MRRFAVRLARYVLTRLVFAVGVWWTEFSFVLLPWSRLRSDNTGIGQLRRLAIDTAWTVNRPLPDRLMMFLVSIAWPVTSAVRAVVLAARQGRVVRRLTGKSTIQQWRECVAIANRLNYEPQAYYTFRFYDPAMLPGAYIQTLEFGALLFRDTRGEEFRVLNKVVFFEECSRAGLPTPPIVAVLAPGRPERWMSGPEGVLPQRGLFLKVVEAQGAVGAERWEFDDRAREWVRRGVRHNHEAMLAHCRSRAVLPGLIVQHIVANHADVQVLCGDTLSTIRITTYKDAGAPSAILRATFKAGRTGADADNLSRGGLSCLIDPVTGELGVGLNKKHSTQEHTHHPDTGIPMLGHRLTTASTAIELALRAHDTLALPWSVGWDVALTPDGPMLIEGNPYWGAWLAQVPHRAPLPDEFVSRLLARITSASNPG